jgi:hypothetical protein
MYTVEHEIKDRQYVVYDLSEKNLIEGQGFTKKYIISQELMDKAIDELLRRQRSVVGGEVFL